MVNGRRVSVVDQDPEVAHANALALKAWLLQRKSLLGLCLLWP